MSHVALRLVALLIFVIASFTLAKETVTVLSTPIDIEQQSLHHVGISTAPPSNIPLFEPLPLAAFPQTLSRPLFFEGRTFPVAVPKVVVGSSEDAAPVEQVAAQPNIAADAIKLRGIFLTSESKRAMLEVSDKGASWYVEGQKLEEWEVLKIESNSVELRSSGGSAIIELYHSKSGD